MDLEDMIQVIGEWYESRIVEGVDRFKVIDDIDSITFACDDD